jgi:osmoprotectant transport system permease protein
MLAAGPDSFLWWDWVTDHLDEVWERTLEHVQLTGWALLIGLLISAGLSAVILRWRRTYGPITGVAGFLYTIPSLALFTFLIPYTGLGFTTAEVGLVSYTLLILVRNMVAGVDAVPVAVTEAADGMGFTRLRAIDLPLAVPTIVAGLRVASVTVIGLVTVTALVGAGGYGAFINDGLKRDFSTPILLGTGLSVLLALVVDLMLSLAGRLLTPWARRGA